MNVFFLSSSPMKCDQLIFSSLSSVSCKYFAAPLVMWFVVQPTLSSCSLRTGLVYPTFWMISACWLHLIKLSGRYLPAPTYHPGPKCQSLTLRSRRLDAEWTAVTHFKLWFHDIWWHFCQALVSSETAPFCVAPFFDLLWLSFSHISGETSRNVWLNFNV